MAHQTTNPDRDYDRLQRALDRQVTGAPASATFTQILRLLYAPDEAALAARLPVRPARLETLARQLGRPPEELDAQLTRLADRGLVLDLSSGGRRYYALPPVVIGFFEFTFMRARPDLPMKELAALTSDSGPLRLKLPNCVACSSGVAGGAVSGMGLVSKAGVSAARVAVS